MCMTTMGTSWKTERLKDRIVDLVAKINNMMLKINWGERQEYTEKWWYTEKRKKNWERKKNTEKNKEGTYSARCSVQVQAKMQPIRTSSTKCKTKMSCGKWTKLNEWLRENIR